MIPRKGFPEKSTIAARFIIFFLFCITALFTAQSVLAAEVQVRDDAGSPISGINVYAFSTGGAYTGVNSSTDSDGNAVFNSADLSAGPYRFRADYRGYQFWSNDHQVEPDSAIPLTIAHQQVTITVGSMYEGADLPLEGVPVYVFTEGGAYMNLNATTDAGGTVTFNLPQQAYKFRADYFGAQYWTDPVTWQDATIQVPLAEAEVMVTGMGQPLENVPVYVFATSGAYLSRNGTTNAEGKVTFRIPAGDYKFRADYQGSQYWSADQALAADQVNPVGVSTGGGIFEFTVLRGVSDPLVGVSCYLFTEAGSYLNQTAVTDANGQVTFPLADGTYKIRTDFQGYQYWSEVYTVPTTLARAVTIAHQPVVITVNSDYQGTAEPLEGIPVYVYTDGGAYMNLIATTDAGGTVTFNLPQQVYKFRADYFGAQYWSDPVTWQDATIQVPLAEAEIIVTGMGQPVENVPVYVFATSGAYLNRNGTTDVDGKVTFRIPAGDYKFRADYQGSQYWSADQALVADQVNPVGVSTGGGIFEFTVLRGVSDPLVGVNCYLFTEAGSYLNQTAVTDVEGKVTFSLADGSYKIRTDYSGYQYWSDVYLVPDVLSDVFTIAHQATTISVVSTYPESTVHAGLPVYLFTSSGSYLGQSRTTDVNGQVAFYLPDSTFKVRVDYMSRQFWSEEFQFENGTVTIPMGTARVHVSNLDADVQDANVYLFSEGGGYLNVLQATDPVGSADFVLPAGYFKFRVDFDGKQYWSPVVDILANQINPVEIDISPLSVTLSAEPATIIQGQSVELTWTSRQATSASIDNSIGEVAVNGSLTVTPTETTTYTITVTGPEGTEAASTTVTVTAAPTAEIQVVEPDGIGDTADQAFAIFWKGTYSAQYAVSLYYDVDNTGFDGVLIADSLTGIGDGATNNEYIWDTSGTPAGVYYIYAVADDGQGQSVKAYSTFPLVISHAAPPLTLNQFEIDNAAASSEEGGAPALHINGDFAILGANGDDWLNIPGSAHVFKKTDQGWVYQAALVKAEAGSQAPAIELEVADNNGEVPHLMDGNYTSGKEAILDFEWGVDINQIMFRRPGGGEESLPDITIEKIEFLVNGNWESRTGTALWSPNESMSYVSGTGWLWTGAWGRLQAIGSWAQGYRPTQIRISFEQALTDDGSMFGHSVAVNQNYAVVGSPGRWELNQPGSAHIFKRSGESWVLETELQASDGIARDLFGQRVAIFGDCVVVSAPSHDSEAGQSTGAVYVFKRGEHGWYEEARLQASDAAAGDWFGDSVAIHNRLIIAGATYADSEVGNSSGAAYIFQYDGEGWNQQIKLTADDATAYLYLGQAVSIDGPNAIIGAAESAYIFHLGESGWNQQAKLISTSTQEYNDFGMSVSISGDFAVVGDYSDTADNIIPGAVYIFKREGSATWVLYRKLSTADAGANSGFGDKVSISQNCVLTTDDDNETSISAHFIWLRTPAINLIEPDGIQDKADEGYVIRWTDSDTEEDASISLYYDLDGAGADGMLIVDGLSEDSAQDQYVWNTSEVPTGSYYIYAVIDDGVHNPVVSYSHGPVVIDHTPPASIEGLKVTREGGGGAHFGRSVAIDGDYAVIGTESEKAYIYHFDGTSWILQAEITSTDTTADSDFGWDVDIQGNTVIVGAYRDSERGYLAGAAFIFEREGEIWVEKQKLTASNTDAEDSFGASVALDNGYAIIGADAKYAVRGTAYVFMRAEESWIEIGELNVGDLVPYAYYGQEVAISGNYAVISARFQTDGNGTKNGAAYIFKNGESWSLDKTLLPGELGGAYELLGPVSIDGDTVAMQVYSADGVVSTAIYRRDGQGFWQQPVLQTTGIADNNFFHAMALKGSYFAASNCISASLFRQDDPGWDETAKLYNNDSNQCRYLSLDISDGWAVVGSTKEASAYFYPFIFAEMEATPPTIQDGESATLQWNSMYADTAEIDQGIGPVATFGSVSVTPTETTTYNLTVTGAQGTANAYATVAFPPPFVSFKADPPNIPFGGSVELSWDAVNAETVTIDQGIGAVALTGSSTVSPLQNTVYTITARGPGGTATTYVAVKLPPVKVEISADPQHIQIGESATLSWTTLNGDSCSIEPGIGTVALSGTQTVSPTENTTYTINATGPGEADSDTVTVVVDSTAPAVSQTVPAQGSTVYTAGNSLDLSIFYGDDNAGICTEHLFDAEGNDITDQANITEEGVLTLNITNLVEGEYRYTLELTDCSGNTLQQEVSFNVGLISGLDNGFDFDEQQGGGGLVGETLRILNGNVVEVRSDLAFPSPHRHGLVFNAVYNSQSDVVGALGHGWTHTYEATLQDIGGGQIKITDHTGRVRFFENQGEGFQGLFNEKSRLASTGEGYRWTVPSGLEYGFNSAGQLDTIEDAIGNRLELAYVEERLTTVTDAATGRQLDFNYGEETLSSIDGPMTPALGEGNTWVSFGYDGLQNLTDVYYADGSGFQYVYGDVNDPHNLSERQNQAGHLLASWEYDAADRCVENFSAQGQGFADSNYVSDDQVEVTDDYGNQRTYTLSDINGRKRVTAMSGPAASGYITRPIVRWAYDDATMNLVEVETAEGTLHRYQNHDSRGNPRTVVLAADSEQQRILDYTWHPDFNRPLTRREDSVFGEGDKETIWDYDSDGNDVANESPDATVTRMIERGFTADTEGTSAPYDYITTYTYNEYGQLTSVDGPLTGEVSDVTSYYYHDDSSRNLYAIDQPIIGMTTFTGYDAAGNVGMVTDVNAQSRSFEYDGRNRITRITHEADGSSSSIQYNTAGLKDRTIDEDDISQTYSYEPEYGRLERTTDFSGNYIANSYNFQGDLIERGYYDSEGTLSSRKQYAYTGDGHTLPGLLYHQLNPDGTNVEYQYNAEGRVSAIKDARDNTTSYQYDTFGRVARMAQPGEGAIYTYYGYDQHGNLNSVIDGNGAQTVYTYDDMGRLCTTVSPDTGTTRYTYDAAGNLVEKMDAKGIVVSYEYDGLNRMRYINFPDASQNVAYTYDEELHGKGRLTGMTDPSGSTRYYYDIDGRLTEKTTTVFGQDYTFSRTFTPAGRLSKVFYPSGRLLDFDRSTCQCNVDGIFTSLGEGEQTTLMGNLNYSPFGAAKSAESGSGSTVSNSNDENGRLSVSNQGEPREHKLQYDGNGNLEKIEYASMPWKNQYYDYDPINRLIQADGPYGRFNYTYDNVGNRQSKSNYMAGQQNNFIYEYETGNNRLDRITGPQNDYFSHDANGNITSMRGMTLTYNQNNRLVRIEQEGGLIGEYVYNGSGQRIIKTVDGVDTIFLYDFDGNIVAEYIGDGTLKAEYLYRGENRLAMADGATGEIYFYQNDRLGTPIAITNSNNDSVWEATYLPFGEAIVNPNATVENNFRFPGQYFDTESGFHFNYYRYYDHSIGRYLRADPIGLTGGINPFSYAYNNPIFFVDPFGLLVQVHSRDVKGTGGMGAHTYITVTTNGVVTTVGSYENNKDKNIVRENNPTDHGPNKLPRTSTITIFPPPGMSQKEWDKAVLDAARKRLNATPIEYEWYGGDGGKMSGNCHTTTRGIIEDAGGHIPKAYNPPGLNPGLHP